MLVKGFVNDMLRASFADVVGLEKCVDDVGLFDHVDIANVVRCAAFAGPFLDAEAHDHSGLGDEPVTAFLGGAGVDDGGRTIKGGHQFAEVHPCFDNREVPCDHHHDIHGLVVRLMGAPLVEYCCPKSGT